jgi:hypothetical protein
MRSIRPSLASNRDSVSAMGRYGAALLLLFLRHLAPRCQTPPVMKVIGGPVPSSTFSTRHFLLSDYCLKRVNGTEPS